MWGGRSFAREEDHARDARLMTCREYAAAGAPARFCLPNNMFGDASGDAPDAIMFQM